MALVEQRGDHQTLTVLLDLVAEAQRELGRAGQARETAERSLQEARQAGAHWFEGWAELRLGELWCGEDPAVAAGHWRRGLAIGRHLDDPALQAWCLMGLAVLALDQEDVRGARGGLRDAAVRGQVLMSFEVRAHLSVAGQAGSFQGTTSI